MMGYALRTEPSRGVRDALSARALYLRQGEGGAGPDSSLLLVSLDLCLLAVSQAALVRERLSAATGLPRERIAVCCTHTHAGPETGLAAAHTGQEPPPWVPPLLETAVRAGAAAVASARPARLGAGAAEARIGRNRAVDGGPIDPQVLVARVDRADGAPLAVLFVHGCHPTVLGHEQRELSADWPGAARRAIEASLPGVTAIFGLGAHGDVDPRTRGLQDLAREGRSLGAGCEAMEALGREVGEAAAKAAQAIEASGDAPVAGAATRVRVVVPGGALDAAAREAWLERRRAEALAALGLAPGEDAPTRDLFRLAHERSRGLPAEAARERIAQVRLYLRDRQAPYYAGGLVLEAEAQVLRLGPAVLLGLPFEASAEVGLEWRAEVRGRGWGREGAILSLTNGWLRYLPHGRHFAGPFPHHRYDVVTSTFGPETAENLLRAGARLAEGLD